MEERNAVVRALTHTYKLITRFGREGSDAARVSQARHDDPRAQVVRRFRAQGGEN